MGDVWEFGEVHADESTYIDGTVVPHRTFAVLLNGSEVGEVNVHMHKRRGRDRVTDVSFGFTGIVYGPAQGGN